MVASALPVRKSGRAMLPCEHCGSQVRRAVPGAPGHRGSRPPATFPAPLARSRKRDLHVFGKLRTWLDAENLRTGRLDQRRHRPLRSKFAVIFMQ
jgi:hypothetical protein